MQIVAQRGEIKQSWDLGPLSALGAFECTTIERMSHNQAKAMLAIIPALT